MLKIKDSVNLKELEKFGFYEEKEYYVDNMANYRIGLAYEVLIIEKSTRRIKILIDKSFQEKMNIFENTNLITGIIAENVYDLIKADMVEIEKVEE